MSDPDLTAPGCRTRLWHPFSTETLSGGRIGLRISDLQALRVPMYMSRHVSHPGEYLRRLGQLTPRREYDPFDSKGLFAAGIRKRPVSQDCYAICSICLYVKPLHDFRELPSRDVVRGEKARTRVPVCFVLDIRLRSPVLNRSRTISR